MNEVLKLNRNLFGFSGVIGRRDYIFNCVVIILIIQLFTAPIFLGSMNLLYNNTSFLMQLSDYQRIVLMLASICIIPISFSNIIRRLSDIMNRKSDSLIYGIAFMLIILLIISIILPFKYFIDFYVLFIIIGLFLMIKKGAVTGTYPVDPVFKFNWGAFFGTWIWGLFNKTYITLFEILLFFTPVGMLTFPLICGLKGNEWAYKNKGCPDIEVFHKSQRMQAKIFSIVMTVGMAVIITLTSFFAVFMIGKYMSVESNRAKVEQRLNNYMESYTKQYFTKINITKNENKFYMSPEDWKNLDMDDKYQVYKLAITYAASKNGTDKYNEINKTTIYSNYNKEILAKYIQQKENENAGFFETMQTAMKSFYLNERPKIPYE